VLTNFNGKRPSAILLAAFVMTGSSLAADKPVVRAPAPRAAPVLRPCDSVSVDPPTYLTLGKSRVVRLAVPATRIVVGGQATSHTAQPMTSNAPTAAANPPAVAPAAGPQSGMEGVADVDIVLLSPTELYFVGKKSGSMNVVLQSADGRCVVKDIIVTIDPETLQAKLRELMPDENTVKVSGAENALVLTGSVSDAVKLDQIMNVATSYGEGKKVVNLLRVNAPQQVMLEVKIAEVGKTLLDHFGLDFSRLVTSGSAASVISGIVGGAPGLLGRFKTEVLTGIGGGATSNISSGSASGNSFIGGIDVNQVQNPDGTFTNKFTATPGTISKSASLLGINAQKKDGVLRVLAEPNIMAISGQSASFLSGGKIFIPVPQSSAGGGVVITLEEKQFGVGLKFTPTVLDGSRINLKLVSEVSELSQTGAAFTTVNGVTSVLPSITSRQVDTTVQLNDGQSFAIAGLIGNNMNEALTKFPGLGEVPVMGALFRSTEFQTNQTELMFLVTPRLVKPLTTAVALPTDNHVVPSRSDVILMGSGEGKAPAPVRAAAVDAAPAMAAAPAPVLAPAPVPAPAAAVDAAPVAAAEAAPVLAPAPAAEAAADASPAPVRTSAIEAEPIAAMQLVQAPAPETAQAEPIASNTPATEAVRD
jgi:pilus assembly protein CpaC